MARLKPDRNLLNLTREIKLKKNKTENDNNKNKDRRAK